MSSGTVDVDVAMRVADPLADAALAALRRAPESTGEAAKGHANVWQRVRSLAARDADCARLVAQVQHLPAWVDPVRLHHAGTLFSRHALEVTSVFTLGSLVETYLVPGIADLLAGTGLLVHHVQRRLAGTGKFVLDVVTPGAFALAPNALSTRADLGSLGVEAVLRVRLLHASVRAGIHRPRPGTRNGGHAPINQAETLFTLYAHSTAILRGLARLGVHVDPGEAEAYQHLWRYVGYLFGLPEPCLATSVEAEARAYDHLRHGLIAPNRASVDLTHALLHAARFEPPLFLPPAALAQLTRFFVGESMADALALPASPASQRGLHALATARARLGSVGLPLPEGLRRSESRPEPGRLAPALGYRYYRWMVHRSARISGRVLPEAHRPKQD